MLDILSAAGHHQYAKGTRVYYQLIKQLSTSSDYNEIIESLNSRGNNVVRYSCYDWSGNWCDYRANTDEGSHKWWVQTLNHFSDVSICMEKVVEKDDPLHSDLVEETQMKRDAEAVELSLKWLMKTIPSTMIEINSCLCPYQQNSQALQMMQSTLKERLKFKKLLGKCR